MSGRAPASPAVPRCPACGQPSQPTDTVCSLCGFQISDRKTENPDASPYAQSVAEDKPDFRAMCEWIWFAGHGRLKHLAMMQASPASARFARRCLVLLYLALALLVTTRVGWKSVSADIAIEGHLKPHGRGWIKAAAAPEESLALLAPSKPITLWWNPAQSSIAAGIVLVYAPLMGWMLLGMTRTGIRRSYPAPIREEKRMSAGLHYLLAWSLPVTVGILVACLSLLSRFGRVMQWRWIPAGETFRLAAGVVVGLGLVLGWFWLIRLGASELPRHRKRIVFWFSCIGPLLLAIVALGGWYGLRLGLDPLFTQLDLAF